MWCWRRTEVSWTDRVKNEEQYYMEPRRIISYRQTVKTRAANRIGQILRRNCLVEHVIEGKIEVTGRRGRRRKQLLDGLKKNRDTGN